MGGASGEAPAEKKPIVRNPPQTLSPHPHRLPPPLRLPRHQDRLPQIWLLARTLDVELPRRTPGRCVALNALLPPTVRLESGAGECTLTIARTPTLPPQATLRPPFRPFTTAAAIARLKPDHSARRPVIGLRTVTKPPERLATLSIRITVVRPPRGGSSYVGVCSS